MTTQSKLPDNCEIEFFDDDDTFRLWFYGEHTDPYISEIYGVLEGEEIEKAAIAVCERFDWIDNPPNKED